MVSIHFTVLLMMTNKPETAVCNLVYGPYNIGLYVCYKPAVLDAQVATWG